MHTWLRALRRHIEPESGGKSKPALISHALWCIKKYFCVAKLDLWEATVVVVPWKLEWSSAKELYSGVFAWIVDVIVVRRWVVVAVLSLISCITTCDLREVIKRLPPLLLHELTSSSSVSRSNWARSIVTRFLREVSKQGGDLLLAHIIHAKVLGLSVDSLLPTKGRILGNSCDKALIWVGLDSKGR